MKSCEPCLRARLNSVLPMVPLKLQLHNKIRTAVIHRTFGELNS